MNLSDGQLDALRNLSRKRAGAVVGWIAIAEARGLTDLGFAARNPGGWEITEAGAAVLAHYGVADGTEHTVVDFHPSPRFGR